MLRSVPEFLANHYINVICVSLLFNTIVSILLWGVLLNGLGCLIVVLLTDFMWWNKYGFISDE